MRTWAGRILVATVALALPLGAFAATTNTGRESGAPFGQHVLSEQPTGALTILYAPSEDDDPALRAAIAAFTGGTVDYFDARAATPDVATLQNYECVYTWANYLYSDNILFGDNLATYVDGGGSVVLGAFAAYTSGNYLGGAIMGAGYCPVTGGTNHFATSNYAGDGTTPIHTGVTTYECVYRDILTLQGGGLQDGSYLDGEIAHAYRPDFRVIYSNGSGATQLGCTGDWALLVANACGAASAAPPVANPLEIPTLGVVGLVALGLALALGATLVMRRRTA